MLQPRRRTIGLGLLVSVCAATACFDQVTVPGDDANERVEITNDEFVLGQRVEYPDEDLPIDAMAMATSGPAGIAGTGPALAPRDVDLRLIAESSPPVVDGETVQATSVSLRTGNRAIVSYNFAGAPTLGAIDLFQVVGGGRQPRLRSSAAFLDTEVSAISMDDSFAWAAMASADPGFQTPAVVERLVMEGNKFTLDGNLRVDLASFVATSTVSTGSRVYATTGDDGAVYGLDPDDLSVLGSFPLSGARWVAWDEPSDRIVVAQGAPGRLSIFSEGAFPGGSMDLLATHPFPGAGTAGAKTTVEIHGGKAFIAAGADGVQIVCLDNGEVVGSVPRPDPASVGLDPSVVVTNAVTVQEDLLFISNGEAGVYAAAGEEIFSETACDAPQSISVLGRLRFDDLQSANHVAVADGLLYVAAGLGGIKVVDVRIRR